MHTYPDRGWRKIFRCVVTALWAAAAVSAQVNVLTSNYNNERNNWNPNETVLNPSSVNPSNFGKIGSFPVDGQIYAQPLYVSGLQFAGAGARDVVYVATMHNS